MKRILIIAFLSLVALAPIAAQKFSVAYVDMQYILKNLPQYETANEQLNMISKRWQKDIDAAIRKALRENDPRIKEAAEAYLAGDFATYNKLREEIIAEGNFSWEIVTDALKAEYNYLKNKAKEDK